MIRIYFLPIIASIVSLIFILRLVNLQIIDSSYKLLSDKNAVFEETIYPERGLIFDRNGKVLVSNQSSYDLMGIPENIYSFDTIELSNILKIDKTLLINNLKKAKKFSSKLPSIIVSQISKETNAIIQEKIWKYDGLYLQKKSIRHYPNPIASNLLGYISEVNKNDLKKYSYYESGDLIGRQGIEEYYENYLRGGKGKKFYQKDRFNRIIGPYENGKFDIASKNSNNLSLTIDLDIQEYGERLMTKKWGGIVAIEPKSGEVLALISAPSYDPNLLVGRKRSENYSKLSMDTISKPLFDRGLQAQYAPGSPFKTINALVALQEGTINDKTIFECNEGHFYARGMFMECFCKKGSKNNLLKSIYKSCNTFFSKTYRSVIDKNGSPSDGLENWNKYVKSFGLGNYLGYDLPVGKTGFIPNSNYYNYWYNKGGWKSSTIVSNAIGQGEILATPIQMANFTAAIANRGYFITPHFIRSNNLIDMNKIYEKKYTMIDSIHFEKVIEGMHQVIEKGTAKIAKIQNIEVCGKTGTVENFTKIGGEKVQLTDHSIFIGFAPKKNPEIAICVFVENGHWGARWAAPIASLIIEKYLNKEVERKWLEKRILEGSLLEEYEKPYSGREFTINE
ncbi:MAG: penicillin-binding protein 2 [Bacteroidota bacterium]|nr:penicillin-binding protein 2 [Bacteroidota bacterium]